MRFKSFIVFGLVYYYPTGGLGDIKGSYDTVEEAAKNAEGDRWYIVDRNTWEKVEREGFCPNCHEETTTDPTRFCVVCNVALCSCGTSVRNKRRYCCLECF